MRQFLMGRFPTDGILAVVWQMSVFLFQVGWQQESSLVGEARVAERDANTLHLLN
jgi:hypothetical protein